MTPKAFPETTRPSSMDDALQVLDEALAQPSATLGEIANDDLDRVKTQVASATAQVKAQALDFAGLSQSIATNAIEAGRIALEEQTRKIDGQVRDNIWSILAGVGVGAFALGALLSAAAPARSEPLAGDVE